MVLLTLDDRNPNIIYSNGWAQAGSALEFNKTTTWTAVAGSTAKLTFQGTGVGVFGTIGKKSPKSIAPVSEYSIDGGTPVTFTADQKAVVQTSQAFFQSPLLPDGVHTLTVTNMLASDPLFLDFLMVLADSDSVVPSSVSSNSASATSASSSSSSSSATSTSSSSTSSLSTTSSSSSPTPPPTFTVTSTINPSSTSSLPSTTADSDKTGATKSTNTAAVAGGIIAAIVGVILIVFALLFWYRRHKRRNEFRDLMDNNPDQFWAPVTNQTTNNSASSTQPFNLGPAPPPRSTGTPMSQAQPSAGASYAAPYAFDQPRYPGGYAPADAYNSSPYPNMNAAAPGPGYAPSNTPSYYGQAPSPSQAPMYGQPPRQAPDGYPSNAYIPPSQLLNSYRG